MIQRYSIEIANPNAPVVRSIVVTIAIVNFISFAYAASYVAVTDSALLWYCGLAASISVFISFLLRKSPNKILRASPQILLGICSLIWMMYGVWLPGIMLAVFAVFSVIAGKKPLIVLDEKGISYPSFPPKLFVWGEVDFVLLKDQILSIEMKDNRLLQFTLPQKVADTIEEAKFNSFCTMMVAGTNE